MAILVASWRERPHWGGVDDGRWDVKVVVEMSKVDCRRLKWVWSSRLRDCGFNGDGKRGSVTL